MYATDRSFLVVAAVAICSLLLHCAASAVELSLDEITGINNRGGEIRFALDVRATFEFEPDSGTLVSSGTWIAQNRTGPNLLIRYSHKVEDFSIDADGHFRAKTYECVEGTFGASMLQNYCGHYRYGPNLADDGGFVDDEPGGRPISIYQYVVSLFEWDGTQLTVVLSPPQSKGIEGLSELGLTLIFTAPAEDGD